MIDDLSDAVEIESPIFLASVAGLRELVGRIAVPYGTEGVPVAYVPNSWGQREIQEQLGTVRYPYMTMTLQRFSLNRQGYNASALRRAGIWVQQVNSDNVYNYKLTPILAGLRIQYLTNDNLDMNRFINRWMVAQRNIQFALDKSGLKISIRVSLDEDISVPEEINEDFGTQFVVESSIEMQTYVGNVVERPRITQINLSVVSQYKNSANNLTNQTDLNTSIVLSQPPTLKNSQ